MAPRQKHCIVCINAPQHILADTLHLKVQVAHISRFFCGAILQKGRVLDLWFTSNSRVRAGFGFMKRRGPGWQCVVRAEA